MKLSDLIHPVTRHSWTVRLVVYIAVVVTAIILFQAISSVVFH